MMEMKGIKKSYHKNSVLNGVDMILHDGECVGIVGANGVGKSTLLKIAVGALRPDSGTIYLDGTSATPELLGEKIGYIPQENPLFEELTVKDNLELWYKGDRDRLEKERKEGILFRFGIHDFYKKPVKKLSGGMKKRLSICCALAEDPDILVMDEPGAALDLSAKSMILDTIKEFTNVGKSVMITSHEIPELMICDRVYGMKNGMITQLKREINSDYLQKWIEG